MEEKTLNILLVEDDEVDVMNVKTFKKKNINNPLYVASNGVEALTMLRTQLGRSSIDSPTTQIDFA